MAKVLTDSINYTEIAKAIREVLNTNTTYYPSEMPDAIRQIERAAKLQAVDITANGTYTPTTPYNGFSIVNVNVPFNLGEKIFLQNGYYKASDHHFDGYSRVVVRTREENVAVLQQDEDGYVYLLNVDGGLDVKNKDITANGRYAAIDEEFDGYDKINVNVPVTGFQSMSLNTSQTGIYSARESYVFTMMNVNLDNLVDNYIQNSMDFTQYMGNMNFIGPYAFYNCSTLKQVWFSNCNTIGNSAFQNCFLLTQISFPNCTIIGDYAFYGCQTIPRVAFPKCETIGNYAFYNCPSLTQIYLLGSKVVKLGINSFGDNIASIYVPQSLVTIYKTANNWSNYTNKIVGYTS